MTVYMIAAPRKYIGLAADVKPEVTLAGSTHLNAAMPLGSEFFETDTSHRFLWGGSSWIQIFNIVTTS